MLSRTPKRLLTRGLWTLVMSVGFLTAYGQVHVVHHVAAHSVAVYHPYYAHYRSYAYYPSHSYHVHHVCHPVHHVHHAYPVHHVYHSYPVQHVYHEYHVLYHEYQACCPHQEVHQVQACCPQQESYDHLAHERDHAYHEGFERGTDDAEDARCLDPYHSHHYRHSHSVAYREAFVQGYEAGYHNYTH